MRIDGPFIYLPPVRPEFSRDDPGRILSPANPLNDGVFDVPSIEDAKKVARVEAAEEAQPPHGYPVPLKVLSGAPHVRRALAAYESVLQLQQRDDLRFIKGVDLYA